MKSRHYQIETEYFKPQFGLWFQSLLLQYNLGCVSWLFYSLYQVNLVSGYCVLASMLVCLWWSSNLCTFWAIWV